MKKPKSMLSKLQKKPTILKLQSNEPKSGVGKTLKSGRAIIGSQRRRRLESR